MSDSGDVHEQSTSRLTQRERETFCRCFEELFRDSNNASASIERVALIFQVSASTVKRILAKKSEGQSLQPKVSSGRIPVQYDYGFKETLNDFIFTRIKQNDYISLDIIHQYAREHLDFNQNKTSLYRILKKIGYKYKNVDRRFILIERQQNILRRIRFCARYLELKKQGVIFIFLDETWVYQNGSQVRQWVLESTSKGIPSTFKSEGRRYTILNAGTDDGFLPGCDLILDSKVNDRDYHKTMNGELFKKWVNYNLIPALRSLNSKCVIVMDNAPYHSVQLEKVPTAACRKDTIKQWLTEHNIAFDVNFTKKQLMDLVKPFASNTKRYEIDELLHAEGHEVLRLPPYNCQYNPIELAWGFCKTYYNRRIQSKLGMKDRVVEIWRKALQQCTRDKWVNYIKHAEEEIRKDWEKYMGAHDVDEIPPFIINTASDTSDSEDEDPLLNDDNESDTEEIKIMVVDD